MTSSIFVNLTRESLIYYFTKYQIFSRRQLFKIQPVRGAIATASEHSLIINILAIGS